MIDTHIPVSPIKHSRPSSHTLPVISTLSPIIRTDEIDKDQLTQSYSNNNNNKYLV